ncbi:MAG: class I SAM-dependent methyltransferase [Patescibacteria group bacterium]|nr:class I SAM-dependent methyltransferase [Patescibacteria group bacterium]
MKKSIKYFGRDLEAMSYATRYYQWILKECLPFIQGDIVEIGAGSGTFTRILLENKFSNITAVEPSKNMFELLKQNTSKFKRIQIFNNYLSQITKNLNSNTETFFYINVLEHIENDKKEIDLVYKTLKPQGHVCIFVPALQQLYSSFDRKIEHHRRYHKRQLERILKSVGFKIEKSKYMDMPGVLVWWTSFCLFRRKILSPSMARLYDNLAIPVIRRFEKLISPPLGKNLLIVGKK